MAFEPFVINMVRAQELDKVELSDLKPEVGYLDTTGIDGIIDLDEVEQPADYLEYMLSLRGRSRSDDSITADKIDEAMAWGEWMNTLTGAYALMDDGCTDVFSFYNTLGEINFHLSNTKHYFTAVCFATNKAALAATFIAKHIPGLTQVSNKLARGLSRANAWVRSKTNLLNGFDTMGKVAKRAAHKSSIFLSHMCPPVGFKAGCETGEGFVSYWRWVARKSGLDGSSKYKAVMKKVNSHLSDANKISTNKGAKVISDAKGIAHSVGIGLTIVGIALDAYGIASSDDTKGGRHFSYSLVKNYVGLALGIASLVAMFCIPVVGQVIGVLALIWTALTVIGDQLGKYNKKWKEAYKNSYWYLYNEDPEFRSFYENRELLKEEEKSAAYLVTEKNYGIYKEDAYEFLKNNRDENSYYDDKSQEAITARVFIELEKQGVLTSYYNRSVFKMPDYSLNRLMELWKMKADYMSWKPTEEESVRAENRGFWGKIGHAINPMTYISWAGDKIKSSKYNKTVDQYNIEKVFCCADYVLMKKYQTWITANRKIVLDDSDDNNNDFYQAIGLRIEQSPWNYIPLVGIDMAAWSEDLLIEAFNADAFFVGVKEMMYFKNMIESAKKNVEEGTKEATKIIESVKEATKVFVWRAEFLQDLRDGYRNTPDSESRGKDIMNSKAQKKGFNKRWNKDFGPCTPRNIMKIYWSDINKAMTYDPLAVSQKGAECQLLVDTIKRNLDTAVLMRELLKEKRDALANFNEDFKNIEFATYLKEGSFLNVKGSTFMDWLSELYPAYSELEKFSNLYEKEIDKFAEAADKSNQGRKRHIFGITTSNEEYHPNYVLGEINGVLRTYKNVAEDFEDITSDLGLDGLVLTADNDKVYTEYAIREIKALDPEKAVDLSAALIPDGDNDDY